jgi:hypothetical protein
MMFKRVFVSVVLMAGGAAMSIAFADSRSSSGSTPPVPASSDATPTDDAHTIICRTVPTGSRLDDQKECHSKAEWDRLSTDAQRSLQHDALKQSDIQGVGH